MKFYDDDISGVEVRPLQYHEDDRGWLAEMFRADQPSKAGYPMPIMGYASLTHPGITRGPHEHEHQTDWFCFFGPSRFKLVLWDNRPNSPTYRHRMELEVGEGPHATLVIVPQGVVHGYKNIGTVDGLVVNLTNQLFKGVNRKERADEIRHEADPNSPFRID